MKQVSPWRNWRRRVRQWQCQKNPLHKKWKLPDRTFHNSGVAETVDRRTLLFRTFNRQSLKLWNFKAFRRLLPSNLNGRQTSVRFFFSLERFLLDQIQRFIHDEGREPGRYSCTLGLAGFLTSPKKYFPISPYYSRSFVCFLTDRRQGRRINGYVRICFFIARGIYNRLLNIEKTTVFQEKKNTHKDQANIHWAALLNQPFHKFRASHSGYRWTTYVVRKLRSKDFEGFKLWKV